MLQCKKYFEILIYPLCMKINLRESVYLHPSQCHKDGKLFLRLMFQKSQGVVCLCLNNVDFLLYASQTKEICLIFYLMVDCLLILSFNSLSQFGCKNIFNIIITLESDLFLYSEMIYPRIDIVMPSLLEMRVVLTGIRIYVMKHLVFHVGYLVLVYYIPSHRYVLNGGKTRFYEEDGMGCISFNFHIIGYKTSIDCNKCWN